jgi:hypothetical protein
MSASRLRAAAWLTVLLVSAHSSKPRGDSTWVDVAERQQMIRGIPASFYEYILRPSPPAAVDAEEDMHRRSETSKRGNQTVKPMEGAQVEINGTRLVNPEGPTLKKAKRHALHASKRLQVEQRGAATAFFDPYSRL